MRRGSAEKLRAHIRRAEFYFTPALSFLAKFDGGIAYSSQAFAGSGTLRYSW
jgi:hypothetical protein